MSDVLRVNTVICLVAILALLIWLAVQITSVKDQLDRIETPPPAAIAEQRIADGAPLA